MLNLEAKFSPNIIPISTDYPYGSLKPNTTTGSNDGTPVTAALGNDIEGFKQAAITRSNIDPSGTPDTATNSQLLDSLDKRYLEINYQTWTFATGGVLTDCSQAVKHTDNKWYSWSGVFPEGGKVVAAGTDPATISGYTIRSDTNLRDGVVLLADLADPNSTVSIAGLEAGKVKDAADIVRAATVITGSGIQDVTAAQIGSSILFTVATTVVMPTLVSLGGVTGHYRIMAGDNPITLTRFDGLPFTVRGATVVSVTIPAGSDCYVVYDTTSVYVYGLETHETSIKSYCLVNALGTGAPNELVSAALPANITNNTRYVLTNPFGANVPVICWAEVFYNSKWSDTGWIFQPTNAYGAAANYVQGEGIVVQTGKSAVISTSNLSGGGHEVTLTEVITSAPCRVFVQKLGA